MNCKSFSSISQKFSVDGLKVCDVLVSLACHRYVGESAKTATFLAALYAATLKN